MTDGTSFAELTRPRPPRVRGSWLTIAAVALIGSPGLILRLTGTHYEPLVDAAIFGISILAASFLLAWAAETAELDISQGLALAIIAFIAVLPEYAVDAVLAWKAGADPEVAKEGLAIANMTGGNRLLIGIGWPLVFFLFFYRSKLKDLIVHRERSLEVVFLAIATIYVILIPLRTTLSLIDTIVLVTLFLIYLILTSRVESEDVILVGPSRAMGLLDAWPRRGFVTLTLVYAAAVILASAEPFAEGLVETGREFDISEFLLIQWVAPLASESPEVLVAGLLAWRGRAAAGMGALISSKVNQWTLLIGTLPVAFMLSAGDFSLTGGLPLNTLQRHELLLTAAQSAFAVAVFVNLKMSRVEAIVLFVLFATQLFLRDDTVRVAYSIGYIVLCAVLLAVQRRHVLSTIQDGWAVARGDFKASDEDSPSHG